MEVLWTQKEFRLNYLKSLKVTFVDFGSADLFCLWWSCKTAQNVCRIGNNLTFNSTESTKAQDRLDNMHKAQMDNIDQKQ